MKGNDIFTNAKVVVIGDVMLDRYWWGSVTRISPEAPVPVIRLDRTTTAPGGAANVAVNITSLGAQAFLVGCVGTDDEAAQLKSALGNTGVTGEYLESISERRTCVKTRIIAHSQQVARVDSEETTELDEICSSKIRETLSTVLPAADLIIVSDYAKGTLSPAVLSAVFAAALELNKPVLVDPKGKDFSKYAGATVLTPNRREAAEACKLEESMNDMTNIAGGQLIDSFGFPNVLITESEKGMTLFRKGSEPHHYDAASHEVYDVTGAGDTVIATLGVAFAAGFDLPSAVELANTAAGIAVGQIGTAAITAGQLFDASSLLSKGVAKS
jgi:rfaE bifunctional protein kinase chain/domain